MQVRGDFNEIVEGKPMAIYECEMIRYNFYLYVRVSYH